MKTCRPVCARAWSDRQVSELEYRKNRQDVRFLLLGHYLDLYQLHNQQVVYQKNIEQTRLLVKDMQAAYRQGTALKSDITRYELQLQNLELGLTSTLNQIDVLIPKTQAFKNVPISN